MIELDGIALVNIVPYMEEAWVMNQKVLLTRITHNEGMLRDA